MTKFTLARIFPSFSYEFTTWGDDIRIKTLKSRFCDLGGKIILDSEANFELKISSNRIAWALHPFLNDLTINAKPNNENSITITVTRSGERSLAIGFFYFTLILSVLIVVQQQELQALIFPFACLFALYAYSIMAFHPAHSKIKKIVRDL